MRARERARKRARERARQRADDPQRFLPTAQVGITLVGILSGVFGGAHLAAGLAPLIERIPGVGNLAVSLSLAVVVVTSMAPKSTSTTSLPPEAAVKFLASFSSVAAFRAATAAKVVSRIRALRR